MTVIEEVPPAQGWVRAEDYAKLYRKYSALVSLIRRISIDIENEFALKAHEADESINQ